MIQKYAWEKRITGPFDGAVTSLYWDLSIPVKDIVTKFGFPNAAAMLLVVAPYMQHCPDCNSAIPVYSRSRLAGPAWQRKCTTCEETRRKEELEGELEFYRRKADPVVRGSVSWYDIDEGCGQIAPEFGSKLQWFTRTEMAEAGISQIAPGDWLEYVISKRMNGGDLNWQATRLRRIEPPPPYEEPKETKTVSPTVSKISIGRLAKLRAMPYREYLLTEEWAKTRTDAISRALNRCQVCNSGDARIDVHHRTYVNLGCEHAADLIALCRDCHTLFHENGRLHR